ncbi:hypothetical protein HanIR_Chr03g0133481 [Helianthus annuus]|nr:hypothetical protein HanIR_Chr03g0133481 [Helianthus annuus]
MLVAKSPPWLSPPLSPSLNHRFPTSVNSSPAISVVVRLPTILINFSIVNEISS